MRQRFALFAAVAIGATFAAASLGQEQPPAPKIADELMQPVKLLAGDQPIDVEVGHAAPFVGDFDRDGKLDLLVGQFGGGKLRIYRNVGTNEKPRFDDFQWFKAGADLGVVPAG